MLSRFVTLLSAIALVASALPSLAQPKKEVTIAYQDMNVPSFCAALLTI